MLDCLLKFSFGRSFDCVFAWLLVFCCVALCCVALVLALVVYFCFALQEFSAGKATARMIRSRIYDGDGRTRVNV